MNYKVLRYRDLITLKNVLTSPSRLIIYLQSVYDFTTHQSHLVPTYWASSIYQPYEMSQSLQGLNQLPGTYVLKA